MEQGFKGMSFPFRFSGGGGVAVSSTTVNDFTHIKESIKQILGTRIGERINEVDFGSEVHKQLFEDMYDETNVAILKFYILEAIQKFETRVIVEEEDITVTPIEDGEVGAKLLVEIDFTVIQYLKQDRVTLKL